LENAFEHGLENTIKDGLLQVSCQEDGGALLIHVEDNGKGCVRGIRDRRAEGISQFRRRQDAGHVDD
ncbi:MAG: hypothetical protein LBL83_05150, partial [Clostridiales bacterium]|nr:hypothetical protein [Clostridiales bacterium]